MKTEESIQQNLNIINEFAIGFVKLQNVLCGKCTINNCKIQTKDMVDCINILNGYEKELQEMNNQKS